MPTYTFKNKETGETWRETMSIAESQELIKTNPNIEIDITTGFPAMVSGERLMGIRKLDEGYKDLKREMNKGLPKRHQIKV